MYFSHGKKSDAFFHWRRFPFWLRCNSREILVVFSLLFLFYFHYFFSLLHFLVAVVVVVVPPPPSAAAATAAAAAAYAVAAVVVVVIIIIIYFFSEGFFTRLLTRNNRVSFDISQRLRRAPFHAPFATNLHPVQFLFCFLSWFSHRGKTPLLLLLLLLLLSLH